MRIKKIAISGKKNSGKNTIAEMLGQKLSTKENSFIDNHYHVFAFADPIKSIAEIMFKDLPKDWLYGNSSLRENIIPDMYNDDKPLTVRDFCCILGKLGRSFNQDMWAKITLGEIKSYLNDNPEAIAIVSDVRFQSELELLKKDGFFSIRVIRDHSSGSDISEIDLDQSEGEFDYILDNNGSLQELEEKVNNLVIQGDKIK